jgi:hypothetical protein
MLDARGFLPPAGDRGSAGYRTATVAPARAHGRAQPDRYVYLILLGSLLIATVLYMPHGLASAFIRLGQCWGHWRLGP